MAPGVIVRDDGFHPDDWNGPVVDVAQDTDPDALEGFMTDAALIRIAFPVFLDGRGFSLGRRLRALGYTGRLRAAGPILADQYTMARRSGFDEVEIPATMAARQPEAQWLVRANWRAHDYRSRLRG
ncbi:DUF934 domain-containing protein [Phaeovulum sp.]|uniref:DUF934 domain-containing protein n=1 Tax=Phaeovulum sp. TaxID=2934796 RepID=UPI0039E37DE2